MVNYEPVGFRRESGIARAPSGIICRNKADDFVTVKNLKRIAKLHEIARWRKLTPSHVYLDGLFAHSRAHAARVKEISEKRVEKNYQVRLSAALHQDSFGFQGLL